RETQTMGRDIGPVETPQMILACRCLWHRHNNGKHPTAHTMPLMLRRARVMLTAQVFRGARQTLAWKSPLQLFSRPAVRVPHVERWMIQRTNASNRRTAVALETATSGRTGSRPQIPLHLKMSDRFSLVSIELISTILSC